MNFNNIYYDEQWSEDPWYLLQITIDRITIGFFSKGKVENKEKKNIHRLNDFKKLYNFRNSLKAMKKKRLKEWVIVLRKHIRNFSYLLQKD